MTQALHAYMNNKTIKKRTILWQEGRRGRGDNEGDNES
jgi:hypothetical protein